MTILSTIRDFAHAYRRAQHRYLTERQIVSLPLEIQKDIGWPVTDERSRASQGVDRFAG